MYISQVVIIFYEKVKLNMKRVYSIIISFFLVLSVIPSCQPGKNIKNTNPPETSITNGLINVKMYLPDSVNGYYRSTRFDWSGAVYSLQYKGHEFYGPWFDRIDPDVINWIFDDDAKIVTGPCSALMGPVDEFHLPVGWEEAQTGGTFIKLGVGVLRKDSGAYDRFKPYEVLNRGSWSVSQGNDSVLFVQDLNDPATGYSYKYQKVVRLEPGKPVMTISHSLKNTGNKAIISDVYNHNFVVLDSQAPGPDFKIEMPFSIIAEQPFKEELIGINDNQIIYKKELSGREEAVVHIGGFSDKEEDAGMIIENRKVGAGMRVSGDKPLLREILWSVRTVLAIEPYISLEILPGSEFSWQNTFEYYTISDTISE